MKEQAILELGQLLAETKQAEGTPIVCRQLCVNFDESEVL